MTVVQNTFVLMNDSAFYTPVEYEEDIQEAARLLALCGRSRVQKCLLDLIENRLEVRIILDMRCL